MHARIEIGGLKDRTLDVASPKRILMPGAYRSSVSKVSREYDETLDRVLSTEGLKEIVYDFVRRLGEMFNFFRVDKASLVDPTVDEFLRGRII